MTTNPKAKPAWREARTASPTTRRFFEIMERLEISQAELSRQSGIHVNNFYNWKTGISAATILNMEAALSVMGLELIIQPIKQPGTHHVLEAGSICREEVEPERSGLCDQGRSRTECS
jgi:hypothetical protein